eukprot:1755067-Pyramimonas_sp.AAC.1
MAIRKVCASIDFDGQKINMNNSPGATLDLDRPGPRVTNCAVAVGLGTDMWCYQLCRRAWHGHVVLPIVP